MSSVFALIMGLAVLIGFIACYFQKKDKKSPTNQLVGPATIDFLMIYIIVECVL